MRRIKTELLKFKSLLYYIEGKRLLNNSHYKEGRRLDQVERAKGPSKAKVLNFLLSTFDRETNYLEIGVRNPDHNFNRVNATKKFSVDPGLEFPENPVDFPMTSDEFFHKLSNGEILNNKIKFDVIFIDGLHLAEQVDRDIFNSLHYINEDGFIVLHDCNPPTEWHSRMEYKYRFTPAGASWNGTTWKAFIKWRKNKNLNSCCINSDWGLGIISKSHKIGSSLNEDVEFYEYSHFANNRKSFLNLKSFEDFKKLI